MAFSLIVICLLAYGAVMLLAYVMQGRLIYPAPPARSDVPGGFEQVRYTTADGIDLAAGYRPAREGMPTLLFFHGNGASWQTTPLVTSLLSEKGYGVLAAEYRGYNGNPGSPSEAGLYADGQAAYDFLRARGLAAQDIVLVGNSIGSGVATHLASEVNARALVLISPFDSLEETASRKMRWLPIRQLLRDRYDNSGKFPHLTLPILILHGEEDTLIALDQAQALAEAHPDTKLVTYEGWGHDLVVHPPVQDEIAAFLGSPPG
ncbi:alpha/beta hydrolase [Aurantiacibacter poecillastricola]|uniref:alpha/beta hydrolase n=1 Tax=Aurantiacibacter poecillastricola TaxID=3064385 RepID=UPI00273E7F67|nr:alpha/beta fold hydrolase [Aurantiacibacter sp. 219JJ12-13]MDP5260637.1 alpha/beta fold hydrolase [Aurantiacibacter sp. 219JJ12-13]